jgi:hypothetical protein
MSAANCGRLASASRRDRYWAGAGAGRTVPNTRGKWARLRKHRGTIAGVVALLPPILTLLVGVGLGAFACWAGRLIPPRSYLVSMTVWFGPSPAKRLVCAVHGRKWRYYWDAEYAEPGYENRIQSRQSRPLINNGRRT